ncbi:hypothetical protein [Stenotrophomonas geniculata]|uniref:hypothetical protein n=1 Tax=Stenotrophomonas geniculata TaxID=86188 RepID=UPI002478B4A2|nr:hypothetical protein [Stenotrophomonas geniculata]MDH7550185.1 hypothetical protein [Stenotrophomonas geniculata]
MSAPVDVLATRDPQDDPRVGDVLQVIPPFGAALPEPMTVLEVSDDRVTWVREGQDPKSTDIRIWNARRATGSGERRVVFASSVQGGAA